VFEQTVNRLNHLINVEAEEPSSQLGRYRGCRFARSSFRHLVPSPEIAANTLRQETL
jgi:hypothetical protein